MGLGLIALNTAKADPNYAVSPFGNPELAEDFTHFPYVNPDAPKGGNIVVEALGSFDSLNPYILKGDKATGIALTQDTLLRANDDEPFAKYGLLAQWVDVRDDGLTIRYKIRDEARFHDGSPVTAEDVVWSFEVLRTQGLPLYRQYYGDVVEAKAVDGNIVEFKLSKKNIEMPAILGQFGIFSKADWQDRDFSKTTLSPFLGSGPYRIKRLDAGKFVEFERVQDYWGADLPVNRGFYNFDLIRYDYYRDRTISREAFKAGKIDFWQENSAKSWATAFDTKAVSGGDLVLAEIPHQNVAPMQGFVFNQRKPLFADPLVREALAYLWDFEWVNQNLMFNAYQRTRSFFDNSELAATGLPSDAEIALLEPFRGMIPDRVFTQSYHPPVSDGSGQDRNNLRKAMGLLQQAGFELKDDVLVRSSDGAVLDFEILLSSSLSEANAQALVRGVERVGGKATIRIVDSAQYVEKVQAHDFDMVILVFPQSQSPGNEQREYWGSAAADQQGSRNYFGFKNKAVDALIEQLIASQSRDVLIDHVRALDRILQWNFLLIPHFYSSADRIAYWEKRLDYPVQSSKKGVNLLTWWAK